VRPASPPDLEPPRNPRIQMWRPPYPGWSEAIKMAAVVRGGRAVIVGVIFHTDRADLPTPQRISHTAPKDTSVAINEQGQFDNAAREAFFSTRDDEPF
jgi:putative transposase